MWILFAKLGRGAEATSMLCIDALLRKYSFSTLTYIVELFDELSYICGICQAYKTNSAKVANKHFGNNMLK